jgi:hypothetical protein
MSRRVRQRIMRMHPLAGGNHWKAEVFAMTDKTHSQSHSMEEPGNEPAATDDEVRGFGGSPGGVLGDRGVIAQQALLPTVGLPVLPPRQERSGSHLTPLGSKRGIASGSN